MGEVSPRQFLCEWKSHGGHFEDEDGLSNEDATLARWRGVDRVATRKFRAEEDDWLGATRACYTVNRLSSSSYRHGPTGLSTVETNEHATAAIGYQFERVNGVTKRQRPQSACSAAARQHQLERSHGAIEFEATASRSRAGRVRQRPQSARSRSSTTTLRLEIPRGELASQLEASKWTSMLHRSPCFRQSRLQRLEAETYALLRFALGKTRTRSATEATDDAHHSHRQHKTQQCRAPNTAKRSAADLNRSSSAKQRNNLRSDDALRVLSTSEVACGSGVQVARSKKQQLQGQIATDQKDGTKCKSHRQTPQNELETDKGLPDHGPRNESSASEDKRRALREKMRLRGGNGKRQKAAKKTASTLHKDPDREANGGAPVLGRRTTARWHWTARASLVLPASARESGGDPDWSLRRDEYVLAVAETALPRATANQQPAKIKKSSVIPKVTKKKRQIAAASVTETQHSQQISKSERDAESGVRKKDTVKAELKTPALDEEKERCEDTIATERASAVEVANSLVQSNEVGDRASTAATKIPSATCGGSASTRSDEHQEDISASAPVSAEPSCVTSDVSPAVATPGSPPREEKNGMGDLLPMFQGDHCERGEAVNEISALSDVSSSDTATTASTQIVVARASAVFASEAEEADRRPSEAADGRNEACSSGVCELDAAVAICPPSSVSDSELGDRRQDDYSGGVISLLERTDGYPDLGTEDERKSSSTILSRSYPVILCSATAQSQLAEQDSPTDLVVAPLLLDVDEASMPLQDAIESSTGEVMLASETAFDLATEPAGAIESAEPEKAPNEDRDVDLFQNHFVAVAPEGVTESGDQLDVVNDIGHLGDHNSNDGQPFMRSNGVARESPNDLVGDTESANAEPEQAGDQDRTQLTSEDEASELVPALSIVIAEASDDRALNDSDDRPVSWNSIIYSNDWESPDRAAGEFTSPVINEGSGQDLLSAATEVHGTSRNSVGDRPDAPHAEVSVEIARSSSLGLSADTSADCGDLCRKDIPILADEQAECISGLTKSKGDDVRAEEIFSSIASEVCVSSPTDTVKESEMDLVARPDTDNAQIILTNGSKNSLDSSECADPSLSPFPEADAVATEDTLEGVSEGHAWEQQLEGYSEDNGDELLPEDIIPPIDARRDSTSSANVLVSSNDSEAASTNDPGVGTLDVPGDDVKPQLGERSEDAPATPENATVTLESSGIQDTNNILPEENGRSAYLLDNVTSSDDVMVSVSRAGGCNIDALDEERVVMREDRSQGAMSRDDTLCKAGVRSPLIEPVMGTSAEPRVSLDEESTSPFVDEQGVSLDESLALSRTTAEQQPVIGDTNTTTSDPPAPAPDEPSSLPTECARRIQRQYRCFVVRRLLLDQLRFYLNHHRRQARKRAKRESLRAPIVVVIDHSDPADTKELPRHCEDSGTADIVAPVSEEKPVPVEDTATSSSVSENIGAVVIGPENRKTAANDDRENVCVHMGSEPQLYDCLSRDLQGIASDLDETESHQRSDGNTHNLDELSSASTNCEADEDVQGGYAALPAGGGPAAVDTPSGSMNTLTCVEDPLGSDNLPHEDESKDPSKTQSSCDDQQFVPQTEDLAIGTVDGGILAVEHSASAELPCSENADGVVDNGRNENELEMNVDKQQSYSYESGDDATLDDTSVREEQNDQVERWERYLDTASNKSFYYNFKTGESRWTAPTDKIDTELDQEQVAAEAIIPDELDEACEKITDVTEDTDALTSQTYWEVRRQSSQLGEQRGGWQALVDEATQLIFYYNAATGESTWEPPREFQIGASSRLSDGIATSAAASLDDDQWATCIDPASGMPYYVNLLTNETSWKKPHREGEAISGASTALASIDLCGLAFEGEAELTDEELVDDGDTQTPWTTGATELTHYDESASVETLYEEDYVIDFDDENRG